MNDQNNYQLLIEHYEHCLAQFGDTLKGVDWPNEADAAKRYQVMLDVMRPKSAGASTLLDFGCGASHLYHYILNNKVTAVEYTGLDASEAFVDLSRKKFPQNRYLLLDVLASPDLLPEFDYIVMNGVFTERRELTFDQMFSYLQKMLKIIFNKAKVGIAFNVMSKQVDWERDDLFHMPMDMLGNFLVKQLSRHYVIRNDYGLYEYTVYVYKEPR
ncbi:class I SAM-dependent methyltransferase [Herbaspirillum huttiense]|uniref:class I SAM-dependent methyltransferase n=1 Tax=Herbaspirillum huttiense TaxID=863372 RepID=UPI0039B05135